MMKELLFREKAAFGSNANVASAVHLYGLNGAVTTTYETVWDESTVYAFLTAAATMTISSDSANDTSAGTGARTVQVTGVSGAYASQTETATMNGTTGVTLSNTYLTITKIEVLTAGSGGQNAGIIYVGTGAITAGKPAVVEGLIAATLNLSSSFIYCVPSGFTLLLHDIHAGSRNTTAGGHQLSFLTSVNGGITKRTLIGAFTNTDILTRTFETPLAFAEKTQLQASVLAGAGTGPVYASATGILVRNSEFNYF